VSEPTTDDSPSKTNSISNYAFPDDLNIKIQKFDNVWSPYSAPDLLKLIQDEGFKDHIRGKKVCDICTGSGIIGIWAAKLGAKHVTMTDFSPLAVKAAKYNAELNAVDSIVKVVQSDRLEAIKDQSFDLIISNPPVQPWLLTGEDPLDRPTAGAWNEAGQNGRLVLDSLLTKGKQHLNPNGAMIFDHSSRHGIETTHELLNKNWGKEGLDWKHIRIFIHEIDMSYHGPYLPIWEKLDKEDGQKRLLTKSDVLKFLERHSNTAKLMINGDLKDRKNNGEKKYYYTYYVTVGFNHA
jgi:methylase of polypeptide subunit release factors